MAENRFQLDSSKPSILSRKKYTLNLKNGHVNVTDKLRTQPKPIFLNIKFRITIHIDIKYQDQTKQNTTKLKEDLNKIKCNLQKFHRR